MKKVKRWIDIVLMMALFATLTPMNFGQDEQETGQRNLIHVMTVNEGLARQVVFRAFRESRDPNLTLQDWENSLWVSDKFAQEFLKYGDSTQEEQAMAKAALEFNEYMRYLAWLLMENPKYEVQSLMATEEEEKKEVGIPLKWVAVLLFLSVVLTIVLRGKRS